MESNGANTMTTQPTPLTDPDPIPSARPVPTVAEILKVLRAEWFPGDGVCRVEVGVRAGTVDASTWDDDEDDLEELLTLGEVLRAIRRGGPVPASLDLYVYGTDEEGPLLGNLDLIPGDPWRIKDQASTAT